MFDQSLPANPAKPTSRLGGTGIEEEDRMGNPRISSEIEGAHCPACGNLVRMTVLAEEGRIQCPACTKIAFLNGGVLAEQSASEPPAHARLAAMELRLESLERAFAAVNQERPPTPAPKFHWVGKCEGDYSAAQAEVLHYNLSTIVPHRIIIQTPKGNEAARTRAGWFKMLFSLAHWPIQGPEDAPEPVAPGSLTMAMQLPVSPEAAATYLAIRAAGFDLVTIFDPDSLEMVERLIVG